MDKIIEAFQGGSLQIDFIELVLVQNTATDPIEYRGTGYIRQTETEGLTLQLYSVETKNNDFMRDLNSASRVMSGTLYKEADYFTLTGRTLDGSVWTAKNILPHGNWHADHPNPIIRASIGHCERGERSNTASGMRLHYFDKADIPCLVNQANFVACGFDFEIKKAENSFTIQVKSKDPLPDHIEVKIEESIRFLLAKTVSVRVIEGPNRHLQLYSRYPSSHRTYLPPPISRGGPAFNRHSWQLFEAYLAFVVPDAGAYWHTCSNHLHNACEASANALDAWAIGLGVAVEGLAGLLPKELDPALKTKLEALRDFVNAQVTSNEDHSEFAPRIGGMMNGLTTIRAVDRMNALAANGGTLPALVKDWTALRNRGVHPTKSGVDPSQIDHQKLVDQVHHVTALMYHIVFALIGYKGPCTNYAEHGFPERAYPPEPIKTADTTSATSPALPASPAAPAKTKAPAKSGKTSPKGPRVTPKPRATAAKRSRGSSAKKSKAKTVKARKRKSVD
jgi:hypothetical protein